LVGKKKKSGNDITKKGVKREGVVVGANCLQTEGGAKKIIHAAYASKTLNGGRGEEGDEKKGMAGVAQLPAAKKRWGRKNGVIMALKTTKRF